MGIEAILALIEGGTSRADHARRLERHGATITGLSEQSVTPSARESITFDRGTEFVSWPHLQAEIGTQSWFCDPSAPWQKGTVENTNRRARRWLPRKIDPTALTNHH